MKFSVAVIPGDGIGPEVIAPTLEVLDAVGDKYGHIFNYVELEAGGLAIDHTGEPLPQETLEAAKQCDALLLGAVGGPKWDTLPGHLRPERALLGLRSGLGVFANLRPAALLPQLKSACPVKDEVLIASNSEGKAAFDLLIVRELTGGLYFGKRGRIDEPSNGHTPGAAFDTEAYSWMEIERVLRAGYEAAKVRRKKLCVVDKANVLESSRFWREVAAVVSKDYPDIETSYLYVDNAAMQLIRAPGQFDVIVTSNLLETYFRRGVRAYRFNRNVGVGESWLSRADRDKARNVRAHSRFRAGHRRKRHRQSARDDSFRGNDAPLFIQS